MMGAMIGALDQYGDNYNATFTFDKYFAGTQTLDKFNWHLCMANDAIKE